MFVIIIAVLCAMSVLSPGIGLLMTLIFRSSGDAAGRGMSDGLTYLFTMFFISLFGGIAAVVLWIVSPDPLPFWTKLCAIYTFLAPYVHIFLTQFIIPLAKEKFLKSSD